MQRAAVEFDSGGVSCAAWHYPGGNGACVVMGSGFAVTKEPGTDRFAERFQRAGFSVLAFDFRRLGGSGGQPRQVVRLGDQFDDWRAALGHAATLPGVDPGRLAVWGFSTAGGQVLEVAARDPRVRAAIAQTPNVDGPASIRNARKYQTTAAMLKLTWRGVLGRMVPLAGEPGTVSMLTTPDGRLSADVLNPGNRYPQWRQEVSARSALRLTAYRPARFARQVHCPLLVVVADDDRSALAAPAVEVARRASAGELLRVAGDHYAPYTQAFETVVEAEVAFLDQALNTSVRKSVSRRHERASATER